ncbi:MAG TPA: LysR family transcriptional regulator [Stellaceae bacterium]|nr:LysR family transcriptional regulator [Stellaceae bacterium]
MNDRQLRYAHAIWNERSFSRAAAKMGVSQPSLSEQIRLLEEELGFSLFYRNSRGVEASANGLAFLESAASIVAGMSALKELARDLRGKPGATIRIGVNSGLAQSLVPRIGRILAHANIKTRPELVTATTRRILRLVHQQRLDLGVVFEGEVRPSSDKLVRASLAESEIVLLVPPAHPLARRREALELAELCHHPLLVNEPRMGYGKALLTLFAERDLTPEIAGDCDDLESLKYMVESGAGLALAPRIAAEYELTRGLLRAVPVNGVPRVPIQLVRRPEPLAPRIERIRAQLAQELGEPEPDAKA